MCCVPFCCCYSTAVQFKDWRSALKLAEADMPFHACRIYLMGANHPNKSRGKSAPGHRAQNIVFPYVCFSCAPTINNSIIIFHVHLVRRRSLDALSAPTSSSAADAAPEGIQGIRRFPDGVDSLGSALGAELILCGEVADPTFRQSSDGQFQLTHSLLRSSPPAVVVTVISLNEC